MFRFFRKMLPNHTEANEIQIPEEGIQESQIARSEISRIRDAFVRDGAAERRHQEAIRRTMRGEILMDDLFGPDPGRFRG